MECPFCKATDTEVYNSRPSGHYRIWRRRRCLACDNSFTTYEHIDLGYLQITTPDKQVGPYQRYKLFNSIYHVCEGIKARSEAVDALTDTVESKIMMLGKNLMTSAEIAEIVLKTLKPFDMGSFLRYLSLHTDLAGINDVKSQLKRY